MKRIVCVAAALVFLFMAGLVHAQAPAAGTTIKLPEPKYDGTVSVEKALKERRSVRVYKDVPLSLAEVSQLLFAAQGITEPGKGLRTAPSARAQYYLTVFLFAGNVTGLKPGMYRYIPNGHSLTLVAEGDMKGKLYGAAGQSPIQKAPAALVITGAKDRARNEGWMYVEAGQATQNIYLQGVPLGIGTVFMGGFDTEKVEKAINLPATEKALCIMPLGKK